MKKIFISQAMRGFSQDYIKKVRDLVIKDFVSLFGTFNIIESYIPGLKDKKPMEALAISISLLSEADILLAPKDSFERIENKTIEDAYNDKLIGGVEAEILIARRYGIPVIFYSTNYDCDKATFEFNI